MSTDFTLVRRLAYGLAAVGSMICSTAASLLPVLPLAGASESNLD